MTALGPEGRTGVAIHKPEGAGKVAFVTSGARGIGRSIALALAREGADTALFDRDGASLEKTVAELRALGRRAAAFLGDVADPVAVSRAAAGAERELGPIAILVNPRV